MSTAQRRHVAAPGDRADQPAMGTTAAAGAADVGDDKYSKAKIRAAVAAASCVLLSLLPRRWITAVSAVLFCFGLALFFPRHSRADDDRMFAQLQELMAESSSAAENGSAPLLRVPVMSFNIRYDGLESDPRNHFLQRLPRISTLFAKAAPWTAGIQEAFSGQLAHSLSVLDPKYRAVTYRRPEGQPRNDGDAKVAIVYDSTRLDLLEQDYLWLSDTPRVEGTDFPRDDPSLPFDPRCLNIARFKIKQTGSEDAAAEPIELIHFNTHLTVRAEANRRRGAEFAAKIVREWRARYPRALVVFTGDFNTAPGQTAHRTLTAPGLLTDSFSECASTAGCVTSQVANSFHGWRGALFNSYLGRALQVALFTLYGGGIRVPHHMPHNARELFRTVRDLAGELKSPPFAFSQGMPSWPFNRFHVDWILYAKGTQKQQHISAAKATAKADEAADSDEWQTVDRLSDASAAAATAAPRSSAAPSMRPLLSSLLDVRSGDYSSDHFPIVTLFEVTRSN